MKQSILESHADTLGMYTEVTYISLSLSLSLVLSYYATSFGNLSLIQTQRHTPSYLGVSSSIISLIGVIVLDNQITLRYYRFQRSPLTGQTILVKTFLTQWLHPEAKFPVIALVNYKPNNCCRFGKLNTHN